MSVSTEVRQRPRVASENPSGGAAATGEVSGAAAFRTPADCEMVLATSQRATRAKGTARIASWNVRWFPDGVAEDTASSSQRTNVPWLACAIAYLNVDVIALQEIKSESRSAGALRSLVARITELTREPHSYRMDSCPEENGQHLVWVVNERRVTAGGFRHHASINPSGDACASRLRPGFGVNLTFSGGLDVHAIAVHLKSGREHTDWLKRKRSILGIGAASADVGRDLRDSDVIVVGDFNTMGCETCSKSARGAAEALELDTTLAGFRNPMRRVPSEFGCSHYFQNNAGLLDHVLVTSSTAEAPLTTKVEIEGYCRDLQCGPITGQRPTAATVLSDHCPIVVSLLDRDLDG
jgi:endonuclease/exonuclease/phosphatase family metal-dependent hydrolase